MPTLLKRLTEIMAAMGWQHADLVRISGASHSVVSQWLGNGSKPIHSIGKMQAAENIERASGYAALWVAKGLGPKLVSQSQSPSVTAPQTGAPRHDVGMAHALSLSLAYAGSPKPAGRVPVIGTVKMGAGGDFNAADMAEPAGHAITHSEDSSAYAIKVSGDGLYPYASHGSCIIIEPGGICVDGENVLIAMHDGTMRVRELSSQRADNIIALCITDGKRETIERADIKAMHPIGSVVSASKWRPAP